MNSWTRRRMALLSLTAVAVLAACGGGDGATDEGTTADGNSTETSAPMTSEPGEQDDGGEGLPGGTSVCVDTGQAVAAAISSSSTAIAGAMGGTLDSDAVQEVTNQLQAMTDAAPDEIKADLEVIATEIGAFYTAWAEIGYTGGAAPTPEQIEQLEALSEAIDQDVYTEAADNLEAWFEANC